MPKCLHRFDMNVHGFSFYSFPSFGGLLFKKEKKKKIRNSFLNSSKSNANHEHVIRLQRADGKLIRPFNEFHIVLLIAFGDTISKPKSLQIC